jgi:hypothetical protein
VRLPQALGALALALGACGDDATHVSLPHVVFHGGPLLTELNIVTITYPDDPMADVGEQLDEMIPTSAWLRAVGAEYGVRGGRHLASYQFPDPAPAQLTYEDMPAHVLDLIRNGAVPGPTVDGVPVLYVQYFPRTTTISEGDGSSPMCEAALAYHNWTPETELGLVPYAVIPTCYPDSVLDRTSGASHEIIEAATDPFGSGYYVDPADPTDPYHYAQPEVADLCNRVNAPPEDGVVLESSWSNAQADAWQVAPCQPAPDVFTEVIADPATVVEAAPGATVSWDLTGYAAAPTADWLLEARHGYAGDSTALNDEMSLTVRFSQPTLNDGQHATVTATVPPDAKSGQVVALNIWSRTFWTLLAVKVP